MPSLLCFRRPAWAGLLLCFALAWGANAHAAGHQRRDPNIAIRFHTEVTTYDSTFAARVNVGNPPRQVIVEKLASISELDIASFYPYHNADGSYAAAIQLDLHGSTILESLSLAKRGTDLLVAINGRPLMLMKIDKPIKDGIIYIPNGLSEGDIRAMGSSFDIMGQEKGTQRPKPLKPGEQPPEGLPQPAL